MRVPWRAVTPGRLLAAGLVLLAALALALWLTPSGDYVFVADRARPVAPLVSVQGGQKPEDGGGIYFVDVIVRRASLLEQLFGGFGKGAQLYPASAVVPPGVSGAQQQRVSANEMQSSQRIAAAVALRTLGRKVVSVPDGALVAGVEPGLPAAGELIPTDVITAVDGRRVRSPDDVANAMRGRKPGSRVRFTVRRGRKTKTVTLRTVAASGGKRAIVGVFLEPHEQIRLPIRVSIDAGNVGGPSAGLAFALEVLEKLGRDVDHGHRIAATGEMFLDGTVGPIGGIRQKTIGAREAGVEAFLVPAGENAQDARKYADHLRIIPVKSFQQALRALKTLTGKQ